MSAILAWILVAIDVGSDGLGGIPWLFMAQKDSYDIFRLHVDNHHSSRLIGKAIE